jgi:hypothetical protein
VDAYSQQRVRFAALLAIRSIGWRFEAKGWNRSKEFDLEQYWFRFVAVDAYSQQRVQFAALLAIRFGAVGVDLQQGPDSE